MSQQNIISLGAELVKTKLESRGMELSVSEKHKRGNILITKSFEKKETIKVLVRERPTKSNKGKTPSLVWKIRDSEKSDYIVLVNFHHAQAWLFSLLEFKNVCQLYSNGYYKFRMYTEKPAKNPIKKSFMDDFVNFLL